MGLRDIESTLPPGFRFYPSDEELICHYLYRKVKNVNDGRRSEETMVEVDLHTREPWELPDDAKLSANEWYFFSFRDRKYTTGSRTNRATRTGYWKATGKDRIICNPTTHAMVGMRKTLVFYAGRAPSGIKSSWVMHEFRLETPHSSPKEDWVLCRVFHKRKGDATGADQLENTGSSSPTLGFSVSSPSLGDLPMAVDPFVSGCHEQRLMTPTLLLQQQQQQQQDQDLSSSSSSSSNPALATTNVEALLQCSYFPSLQEMEMMMMRCEGGGGSSDQFGFLMDLGPQHVGGVGYNNDLPGW